MANTHKTHNKTHKKTQQKAKSERKTKGKCKTIQRTRRERGEAEGHRPGHAGLAKTDAPSATVWTRSWELRIQKPGLCLRPRLRRSGSNSLSAVVADYAVAAAAGSGTGLQGGFPQPQPRPPIRDSPAVHPSGPCERRRWRLSRCAGITGQFQFISAMSLPPASI